MSINFQIGDPEERERELLEANARRDREINNSQLGDLFFRLLLFAALFAIAYLKCRH